MKDRNYDPRNLDPNYLLPILLVALPLQEMACSQTHQINRRSRNSLPSLSNSSKCCSRATSSLHSRRRPHCHQIYDLKKVRGIQKIETLHRLRQTYLFTTACPASRFSSHLPSKYHLRSSLHFRALLPNSLSSSRMSLPPFVRSAACLSRAWAKGCRGCCSLAMRTTRAV